jgi:hypothetical protein
MPEMKFAWKKDENDYGQYVINRWFLCTDDGLEPQVAIFCVGQRSDGTVYGYEIDDDDSKEELDDEEFPGRTLDEAKKIIAVRLSLDGVLS